MIMRTSDTVPIDAPDWIFVRHYAADIARHPALLTGLRRPDGTLYLPKSNRAGQRQQSRKAA